MIVADCFGEDSVNPSPNIGLDRNLPSRISKASSRKQTFAKLKDRTGTDDDYYGVIQHIDVSVQALELLSQEGSGYGEKGPT